VCDALASGCLLALLRERIKPIPYAVVLPFIVLGVLAFTPKLVRDAIGITVLNLSIVLAMDALIRRPPWVLNNAAIIWVGTLSYSLYLWQQPFVGTSLPAWLKLAGALACAYASYSLVERPARRWINALI
jgi:peptidoglycan/LPS O-acetylase OafA/YrhL